MHTDRDATYWHARTYRQYVHDDMNNDEHDGGNNPSTPQRTPHRAQRATPPTLHREAPRMTMRNGNLMPRARAERMDQDEEAQQQTHDAEEEANLERARQESM